MVASIALRMSVKYGRFYESLPLKGSSPYGRFFAGGIPGPFDIGWYWQFHTNDAPAWLVCLVRMDKDTISEILERR